MKVRLLLDEDVQFALGLALRKRGYDALHIQEIARKGLSDKEQLDFAISEKRCLFSYNVKDFVLLHNRWVQGRQEHCGIIVSKQLPVGEALKKLLRLLTQHSQESIQNCILFL